MAPAPIRAWLPLTALSAAVAVTVVAHALKPVPPPGVHWEQVYGPSVATISRLEAKGRITAEVVAGRLPLLEAAARFKALDAQGRPYPGEATAGLVGVGSADEAYCRMVIAWVDGQAADDRTGELSRSLGAELQARLRDGTLRLPQ